MTRRLPLLLIAALLLQAILAPAHGLAMAGRSLPPALCTAGGAKPADGGPASLPQSGACLACHALPAGAALDPPVLPAPAWTLIGDCAAIPAPAPRVQARPGPPGGARAPPHPS